MLHSVSHLLGGFESYRVFCLFWFFTLFLYNVLMLISGAIHCLLYDWFSNHNAIICLHIIRHASITWGSPFSMKKKSLCSELAGLIGRD